jgi:hypothetical protein
MKGCCHYWSTLLGSDNLEGVMRLIATARASTHYNTTELLQSLGIEAIKPAQTESKKIDTNRKFLSCQYADPISKGK